MPLYYGCVPGSNITTNAVANTANDCFFVSPGLRNVSITSILLQGKGALLTSLSGIICRLEKWTATKSTGGTAITPTPRDPGAQAAKAASGFAAATVTSGTGGPLLCLAVGCSASGPGQWRSLVPDDAQLLEPSATQSLDLFNASGSPSLNFEISVDIAE